MKKNIKIFLLHLSLISTVFIFSSCGIWRDFTGYFNGYYNASNLFEDSEKELNDSRKELFTLQEPTPSGNATQNFTKVIEKLSKLLQFNSKSNLVDDALLMIGKSFYYQKNYQKASRKFNELITSYPESGLVLEAKLWIVKSYFRMNDFDKALEILTDVYKAAGENNKNSILVDGYIEEISYLIEQKKVDDAISRCNKLLEVSKDDSKNAKVLYELGLLYQKNNDPEKAAKAFADVQEYSPDFQTEYNAKLEYGKVQRDLKQYQKSLDIFEDIKNEPNYNENLDKTELEIGISLLKLNKTDEAFEKLRYVDTSFASSSSAGIAAFHLGELIEVKLANFDSAKFFYQRVISSAAPTDYKEQSSKKVQVLNKLNNLHSTIADFSQKLMYSVDSTLFKKDSLAFVTEQARIDSLNKEAALLDDNKQKQDVYDDERGKTNNRSGGRENRNQPKNTPQKFTNKLKMPVRPNITTDSIQVIIAKYKYELAGLFFTELNVLDSANYYYTNIIHDYPNSPYAARTLYALGTYYLTINNKTKADSLFEIVYEKYKNEKVANSAAQQLNKPLIVFDHDPADSLYRKAENLIKNENYSKAVSEFINIYEAYPRSPFAPKALYTSGWLLENKLDLIDSAAVVYDSLSAKYASSVYTNAIRSKLSNYKLEHNKTLVPKDSVKSANDSLNINTNKEKIIEKPSSVSDDKQPGMKKVQDLKKENSSAASLKVDSTGYKPESFKMTIDSLNKNLQNSKKDTLHSNPVRER